MICNLQYRLSNVIFKYDEYFFFQINIITFERIDRNYLLQPGIYYPKEQLIHTNIHWNPVSCAIGYQYQYRKKGSSAWTTGVLTVTNKTLTGLVPQTIYQWRVRSGCKITPDTISSIYANGAEFTTAANIVQAKTPDEDIKSAASYIAKVYPNPSRGEIAVVYDGGNIGNIEIKVIDVVGKQVLIKSEAVIKGMNTYNLNLSHIASGVYYLEIINNNDKNRLKFVIEK